MSTTYQDIDVVLELLCERWPGCFVMYEAKRRPLKVGIRDDIAAQLVARSRLGGSWLW